jgi:hypothetical protein
MQALIRYSARFTTFMTRAYQQPALCLQFQWGQM